MFIFMASGVLKLAVQEMNVIFDECADGSEKVARGQAWGAGSLPETSPQSTRTQVGLMVEQGVTFSGQRLAVKDRKTAVPIFYPPFFTSQVRQEIRWHAVPFEHSRRIFSPAGRAGCGAGRGGCSGRLKSPLQPPSPAGPRQDKQVQQGARTPSSAGLSTNNSVVWAGKKMGGKKWDGFSCQ
jgi:hypothetical protein